jgi:hypothetical protein
MELMLLRTFQGQVFLQCKFLLMAATAVNEGLKNGNVDHVYYALQNLLNAGANISKAIWGQAGRLAEQRKLLRDSIGISDDSPLNDVTMRNNFEHFDERLDRWWQESKNHNRADMSIGPKDRTIVGLDPIDMFRLFDPQTTDLTFWGQEFNVQKIVNEVQKIFPKLQEESNKPHWEPPRLHYRNTPS